MESLSMIFLGRIQTIYYAELTLAKALEEMVAESVSETVRRTFAEQRVRAETHIARLLQVFAALGMDPAEEPVSGMDGLIEERWIFTESEYGPGRLDLFNLDTAVKAAHYMSSVYEFLIGLANRLNAPRVAELLTANLHDEEDTLITLKLPLQETLARSIDRVA